MEEWKKYEIIHFDIFGKICNLKIISKSLSLFPVIHCCICVHLTSSVHLYKGLSSLVTAVFYIILPSLFPVY